MLPALGVLMWMASELATEEFLIPSAILGLFCVLVMFTVFVKGIRFETSVLCALLVGYLVGNRGFADLAPVKPLYPGEIGMVAIFICLLVRFAIARELPDFSGWMARVIFLYCALGAVRLLTDYKEYKLDAVRDSAMVYYSVYYFFGRQLLAPPAAKRVLEGCLKFSFVALALLIVAQRFLPSLNWTGTGDTSGGYSLAFQKDDIMTTFAAAGVFILYTRPKMYRWKWVRVVLIVFYLFLVVGGVGRASLAALVVSSVLMLIANKPRFFLYPALTVVLGLTVLAGYSATFSSTSDGGSTALLVDKVTSMVDFGSNANYQSELGATKAGTNNYRRKLWDTFIDETNAYDPWFGHGFGYNFVISFSEIYRLSEAGGLRSAHNFYVTLFGRMGWIGILVFAVLTVQIITGGIRAALAVRAGWQPLADLGYWCTIWVILISSAVGVVLEGPMAAIVFWTFLGVAVEVSKAAALARREHGWQSLPDFPPLPGLPERRPVSYGLARNTTTPSR